MPQPKAQRAQPSGFPVGGATRITGIFGDPVTYTLSPRMHNYAFSKLNLDFVYVPFLVRPADLKKAVDSLRALNIAGVNVTIPHKKAVIPFLDDLDADAKRIGAVNTVVNVAGRLVGYNTDAAGFLAALRQEGNFNPVGKQAVIIGAGGTAYAMAFALCGAGIRRLAILNRSVNHAQDLTAYLKKSFTSVELEAEALNVHSLRKELASADLLANATPAGMDQTYWSLSPGQFFSSDLFVFDAVYAHATPLLMEARKAGASCMGGLDMLVHQGALSFHLWTGAKPPVDLMKEALKSA